MTLVCAGVILRSGMVLLARRAPGRRHAGLWEFPGGRVESGETPEAALARELREELGIEAAVGAELARVRHAYDFGEIELVGLLVRGFKGEIRLKDHDQVKWVEARKLLEYELTPADVPIAEVVAAHRRRDRYRGTHPRRFEEKYKEQALDPEAVAKAKARGSTPAGAHLPVMMTQVLQGLAPLEGKIVLDCTLGWGGHCEQIARQGARVIGLDRDGEQLARTTARLAKLGIEVTGRHADYADSAKILKELKISGVDALFADLGVSSMQLDDPARGMSFKRDGPLDMRMDRSRGRTAAEWLQDAGEGEICEALRGFGDEPDAEKIARTLVELRARGRSPRTTGQLADAVAQAKGLGEGRIVKKDAFSVHPATRAFQALRIAVNGERDSLRRLLSGLPELVRPEGRAVILTFHSGEEALVASALREQADQGLWKTPLAAPLKPSAQEVRENPRARSARLWRAVRSVRREG